MAALYECSYCGLVFRDPLVWTWNKTCIKCKDKNIKEIKVLDSYIQELRNVQDEADNAFEEYLKTLKEDREDG